MSIVYFPDIYEDELIYSVLARYYKHSGCLNYTFCARDLFVDSKVRPDIEFINQLNKETVQLLCRNKSMEQIIFKHTMFPSYARFLPFERRNKAFQAFYSMQGDYNNLLAVPKQKNGEQRYLRYCPLCAKEDRSVVGESYWHRKHQMMGVNICSRHGCRLCNSSVLICGKTSPSFVSAEEEIKELETVSYGSDLESRFAVYMEEVFQMPLLLEKQTAVKEFLQSRLAGTPYLSVRGQQKKIGLLCHDLKEFYKELETSGYDIPDRSRIEKIFTGYRFHFYEVSLLAYFLNISAVDLIPMELPNKEQKQTFDNSVMEMLNAGTGINETAKQLGVSSKTIRDIRDKKYKDSRAVKQYAVPCGVKAKDWKKLDKETLPLVKKVIKELEQMDRPQKITKFAVCKLLQLPDKRLDALPLCSKEIEKHQTTQEVFWARECIWAVWKIQKEGKKLNWRNVRILTNMRKINVKVCLFELEKLDKDVYSLIRSII